MSVLQNAFRLVKSPPSRDEIDAYINYVNELSHEGVPGLKHHVNLRGTTNSFAYVKLLSEMLKIALSPGGTHEYSLKGLALQVGYMTILRAAPAWGMHEDSYDFELQAFSWKQKLIILLCCLNSTHSDAMVTVEIKKDVPLQEVVNACKLLDAEYVLPGNPPAGNLRLGFKDYLDRCTYSRLRVIFEDMENE